MKKPVRGNIEDVLALTPMQEGMLFHYLKDPANDLYFNQLSLEISGEIDAGYFEKAWNIVIKANEMLRTVFHWEKVETPVQAVLKEHKLQPVYYDLTTKAGGADEKKKRLEKIKIDDRKKKFDLYKTEIPFRVSLCKIEKSKHVMIISNHHILYDGWSTGIILKEFFNAYYGGNQWLKPVKGQFKDFIQWIRQGDAGKQKRFWKDYLEGFDTAAGLSVKQRGEANALTLSENYRTVLPTDIKNKIESYIKRNKLTLASLFYCAWGVLLQKYNNSGDVVFGTTVSGRSAKIEGIENIVGLFINTLPLRIKSHFNETTENLLHRIDKMVQSREVYEHTPLVDIKAYSEVESNEELFDTIVIIENYPLDSRITGEADKFSIDSYSMVEMTHYDLTVTITVFDGIKLEFAYNKGYFAEDTIACLAGHFRFIVEDIVKSPGKLAVNIDMVSTEEKNRILYGFNDTAKDYPKDKSIHGLFEDQAAKTPDNTALTAMLPGTSITYRELDKKSDRLSGLLMEKGVRPGTIAAVMVERSAEMVIAIMAILKAGGAYLPIDPEYPEERIKYMLADSGAEISFEKDIAGFPDTINRPCAVRHTNNFAYIIYTSGSTGKPKGVMVGHRSVVNLLIALQYEYPFTAPDTYLLKTSYVFDVSVTELFGWFLGGGRLAVLAKGGEKDPKIILDTIEYLTVTHINFVPSMFNTFIDALSPRDMGKLSGLRYIFLAGEALLPELVDKFRRLNVNRKIALENIYGPTEGTVYSSKYSLSAWKGGKIIPIGKPLQNMGLYILDRNDHLQPVGVPGELFIAGAGVAGGYLNRPELTKERFCLRRPGGSFEKPPPGPPQNFLLRKGTGKIFSGKIFSVAKKIYKTGDLARWLPDGNIEFLGRMDDQVKIRGFRIEPGEIENRLLNHNSVKEAVVIAREDKCGENFLCAFVVPYSLHSTGSTELKDYLSETLPGYMVPSHVVLLERMPATPSGKIDRKALPGLEIKSANEYIAPRSEREKELVNIMSAVLGIEKGKIGIDDHFFRIGGHSLKAVRLTGKIHKRFNIEIPLKELFKISTVRKIARYMDKKGKSIYRSIELSEKKKYYPLSPVQERLYTLQQRNKHSIVYNMFVMISIEGDVKKDGCDDLFRQLIHRHESLRTSFEIVGGEPVQRIRENAAFEVEYYDPGKNFESSFIRSFDLSEAPLLRVGMKNITDNRHLLAVDMHHIISDGISAEIVLREFAALYRGEKLPPLRLRYKDYLEWQHRNRESEFLLRQRRYWEKEFSIEVPGPELPVDFVRPGELRFDGRQVRFGISNEDASRLKALALEQGTTLHVVLAALYYVFLSKISSREVVVVGTPVAGRRYADLEPIVGMFVNTLGILAYPSRGKTFTRFLEEVDEKTLQAVENQDYSFDRPLYNTVFALQTWSFDQIEMPGIKIQPYDYETGTSKFDLMLLAEESQETLSFTFEYRTSLFKASTIQRFIGYFKKIAAAVIERPPVRLAEIEIIPEADRKQILFEFNNTVTEYPGDRLIHELFEEESVKRPGKIAIGFENQSLSYGELNRRSDQLAAWLQNRGMRPGSPVGIMLDVSLEMIAGVLAVLKAGGVYLPIDPRYPQERVNYMLRDSGLKKSETISNDRNKSYVPIVLNFENLNFDIVSDFVLRASNLSSSELAYIMYTSGSTGKPRGVMVEHRNVIRLVKNTNYISFKENDRVLQTGALAFDASTFEIWGALLNGLGLYLARRETILSRLKTTILNNKITIMWMTSPLFNRMVQDDIEIFAGLRSLLVGGDILSPLHINRLRKRFSHINIINGYGPTENTTFSTAFLIEKEYKESIPIGKPIANSFAYIVDRDGKWQPIGIAGELYVGGDGVSRGYLNNPELTKEKFQITNHKHLSYQTGDLARWLPDGNVEFLGRVDQQVKIRGFRIEPHEIESHLLNHEYIEEAVVLARKCETGDKHLCAYVVSGGEISASSLREFLSARLPEYMIPSYFIVLEKIPLTANGKVDWRALPEPVTAVSASRYTAPRDRTEEALAEIWAGVLELEKKVIGIDADFFELGGHSIKATHLLSKIHRAFNVNLSLTDIFTTPFIRGLARRIKEAAKEKYISIEPAEKKEYYPLSSAQKRLYFIQQMAEKSTVYNMTEIFELTGIANKEKLKEAFLISIKRHESFRTWFDRVEGVPVQKIDEENSKLQITNYKQNTNYKIQITNIIKDFIRPFDLLKAPLLRVGLLELEEAKHILMVDMHHIISDGASVEIIVREFTDLYRGRELSPLKLHYKDFARWERGHEDNLRLARQREYWQGVFSGEIPVLELPVDYVRPAVQDFEGCTANFSLDKEQADKLKKVGQEEGATLFMLLSAVTFVFLSKLSGQEDIVVGTAESGRRHADLEPVIGMFVNTLALRNYPAGEKSFREFLKEVKENTLAAFENRDYPYEDLVEEVAVTRGAGRNPLFDAAFTLRGKDVYCQELPGLKIKTFPFESNVSRFDFTLYAIEAEEGLVFRAEYSTKLFREDTIERFINYFKRLVSGIPESEDIKIREIEIIPEEEKRQILYAFNDTGMEYPEDKLVHTLFEEQAERVPDKIAVFGPGYCGPLHMTYRELDQRSNGLARVLHEKGVKPENIVGIIAESSVETIIGIMAILKSGGVYLPIDPGYPEARQRYMLSDSNARLLLTNTDLLVSALPQGPSSRDSRLAYVIYTSGSTGNPKGVLIEHRSLNNLCHWHNKFYSVSTSDRATRYAGVGFDASVWELFPYLIAGASVCILDDKIKSDIHRLNDYFETNGITVSFLPTQICEQFMTIDNHSLRVLLTGGDKLNTFIKRNYQLANNYGPTENTVVTTGFMVEREYSNIPIGQPVDNTQIYVLDKYHRLQPIGIVGELCIAGDGLARGYLNRPELTKERFCLRRPGDSFEKPPPGPPQNFLLGKKFEKKRKGMLRKGTGKIFSVAKKIYKTGDLARWLRDGNIEFLGRIDHQVKIRGFRIELGEIENRLLAHDRVKEALVVVRGDVSTDKYLCAYIISDERFNAFELRDYLSGQLPAYMIPSYFVPLTKWPLTPNGKVDRKTLPLPVIEKGETYTAPASKIEKKLAEIWSDILQADRDVIGIDADFFELGGHSLKVTALISKIHQAFDVKIPTAEIFRIPSIRGQANFIKSAAADKYLSMEKTEKKDYYPLSSAQKRLYLLYRMDKESTGYNMPAVMTLEGNVDKGKLEETFTKLMARHESLRTSFHMVKEEPVQRIHDSVYPGQWTQGSRCESLCSSIEVEDIILNFVHPFDLSKAPLLRVGLTKVDKGNYLLMIDMHHIVSDGVSVGLLIREFIALVCGGELPNLRLTYKDYARWQLAQREKEFIKKQETYWLGEFSDEIPVLNLPGDFPRPAVQNLEGSVLRFEICSEETRRLKALTLEEDVTLFMVLLSLFNILLSRISSQEDIVIGCPVAGRVSAELEPIIGMFVNILAIRNNPDGEKNVKEFLTEVKETCLSAFENQEYQFEELVEKLPVSRDTGRNPLFDIVLDVQNIDIPEVEIQGLKMTPYPYHSGISKFDLVFHCEEAGDRLRFTVDYAVKIFKEDTIGRFIRYLKKIVSHVVKNRTVNLEEIEILSEEEKREILEDLNVTPSVYPEVRPLPQLFEEQVEKRPDGAAVIGSGQVSDHELITYKELNRKSNQLAVLLKEKGVRRDNIIAIIMERCLEMIITILGILKAGGAYLPIDPTYPPERITFMQEDSNANILVRGGNEVVEIIELQRGKFLCPPGSALHHPSNLAYIIYTSGTTGKPKGVLVEHRNIAGLMETGKRLFNYNSRDVWTMFHSYCFDFSVWEMYGALLHGGKLVLISRMEARAPHAYLEILKREAVTILNQTPTVFYQLVQEETQHAAKSLGLRYVIFGGEALKPGKLKPWKEKYPGTRLINMYGITETTVHVTFKEITRGEIALNVSNVGKPIPSLWASIVDKGLRIRPRGAAGELYVGGQGVARGYLNRPELTAERFIIHHSSLITGPIYRSGDLVRLLGNGEMEYLGRIDHQVKIRGNRVETGEIEREMMLLAGVEEVLVIAREDGKGNNYLCAYMKMVVEREKEVNATELRETLVKRIPEYMIPSYFIPLEKFPVTSTGKVDRGKLPLPGGLRPELEAAYAAPQTGTARTIAGIWQEILNVDKVGIYDNFFQLGGTSLDIVRLSSRLKDALQTEVPIVTLFEHPTVHTFTQHLAKSSSKSIEAAPAEEKAPDFKAKFREGKAKLKGRKQRTRMRNNTHV